MGTPEQDHSDSKIHCPKCNATEARTLIRLPPLVYVQCGRCTMVWSITDRRQTHRPDYSLRRNLS